MQSSLIVSFFIISAIFISQYECFHHRRSKLHRRTSILTDESQPAVPGPEIPVSVYPELVRSYSSPYPIKVASRRRRKSTIVNNGGLLKVFEKKKKLLELIAITELSTDKDVTEKGSSSVENDYMEDNTTLIPLPEGIQLKSDVKYNDSIIHTAVNITSSTQKILYYDNNTEIEKVIEMEMEKKIEDEKGTGKGFEQVRIMEKERVKPMAKSRISKARRKKRKNHGNRVFKHHRSKRSKQFSNEVPRSKSLYNKLTHRFLSAINRKERTVEPNYLITPQAIPDFPEMNRKVTTENTKQTRENSMLDRKEIDDFMKFFLNEMKKFRKSQKNKTGIKEPIRRPCKECNSLKLLSHEMKKLKKIVSYPEHMNIIMNLNMTWDSKMKIPVDKTVKIVKEYNGLTMVLKNTTPSAELMHEMKSESALNVNKNGDERFAGAFFSFIMYCLFGISAVVLVELYKLIKFNCMNSPEKNNKLYYTCLNNKARDSEMENLFSQNEELEDCHTI